MRRAPNLQPNAARGQAMSSPQERAARNRLIDETRKANEKLIREFRKAAKVAARTTEEREREWLLARRAQSVERELADALREAEKFKAYSRQADIEIAQLRSELARLTTPRPIAEAPRDGTWVLGLWKSLTIPVVVQWTEGSGWTDGEYDLKPTHFLPLPTEGGQR